MTRKYYTLIWLVWAVSAVLFAPLAFAQDPLDIRIVELDASSFPLVRVTLLTADGRSAPVSSLADLVIREDGTPIEDVTITNVPYGADFTFVIDANESILVEDDGDGVSRLDKVRQSIGRFAENNMNSAGADSVSILVPEGSSSGRFLVENVRGSAEVTAALEAYAPEETSPTALNAMLTQAIEQAAGRTGNNRYQAILLLTDAGNMANQLSFSQLSAEANAANVPIYVAILGARADENELAAARQLTTPTRADVVHMPSAEATDAIYRIWQQQSTPAQIQYRSLQRTSGEHAITLNIGQSQARGTYSIELAPPEISLLPATLDLVRSSDRANAPLPALTPAELPVALQVAWPDGQPRRVESVTFAVNGEPQAVDATPLVDAAGQIGLTWDLAQQDAGSAELTATIVDELGFTAEADPVQVNITVSRPEAPTPTPVPTLAPSLVEQATSGDPTRWLPWIGLALLAVAGYFVFRWLVGRGRSSAPPAAAREPEPPPPPPLDDEPISAEVLVPPAALIPETGEPLPLPGAQVTLGRGDHVDLVIDKPTISQLHARIRFTGDRYWLYDEGGAAGTRLNFDRVGLAPRPLADGDVVQLGRETFTFRLIEPHAPSASLSPPAASKDEDVES